MHFKASKIYSFNAICLIQTWNWHGFKVSFMLESSILHKGICFWSFEANSNPIPHMHCKSGHTCWSTTGWHRCHLVAFYKTKKRSEQFMYVKFMYINVRPADPSNCRLDRTSVCLDRLWFCQIEWLIQFCLSPNTVMRCRHLLRHTVQHDFSILWSVSMEKYYLTYYIFENMN